MADREPPPMDDENSKNEDDLFADVDDVNYTYMSSLNIYHNSDNKFLRFPFI